MFRNFEISDKYGDIIDVEVKDLETGKSFKQIDEEIPIIYNNIENNFSDYWVGFTGENR